jgi:TPR repeat protein
MMRNFLTITLCLCVLLPGSLPAKAELKYYSDPVYQKLSADDPLPMADVIALAEQGDVRAQFIVGDLYAKGKGGMPEDMIEARRWFELSAMHGYNHSFIRLAAIAKRENKPAEAWQWYTLAIWSLDHDAAERKYALGARETLMETAQLPNDDLRRAKKSAIAWENTRDRILHAEEKAARKKNSKQDNNKTTTAGAPEDEQN